MDSNLVEQAAENGRKAAEAIHRNRDLARAQQIQRYQRNLEFQYESFRFALSTAYTNAYREESSYYVGTR